MVKNTHDQCHASAPERAAIHDQHERAVGPAFEQRLDIRQAVDFRRNPVVSQPVGAAFDTALAQAWVRGLGRYGGSLTFLATDDAANEQGKRGQMTGMIASGFSAAGSLESREYVTIASEVVAQG